jgi:hypothetical protein
MGSVLSIPEIKQWAIELEDFLKNGPDYGAAILGT